MEFWALSDKLDGQAANPKFWLMTTQKALSDCERQENRLKVGISAEYNMMKTGYSEVHGLLVEADHIAEDALQVLEFASKKSLAPVWPLEDIFNLVET